MDKEKPKHSLEVNFRCLIMNFETLVENKATLNWCKTILDNDVGGKKKEVAKKLMEHMPDATESVEELIEECKQDIKKHLKQINN